MTLNLLRTNEIAIGNLGVGRMPEAVGALLYVVEFVLISRTIEIALQGKIL